MKSFRSFLLESTHSMSDVPDILHDFMFHLSGPSDPSPLDKKAYLQEVTVLNTVNKENPLLPHQNKMLPKTSAMIDKAKEEGLGENENLHKAIHVGFRNTFESMKTETPEESKVKLKESHAVLHAFAQSRGLKGRPELLGENGKTEKSTGEGVHTKGLALAPHATNGLKDFDVCPRASSECRKNCLGLEAGGNRQYPDAALSAKVLRTHFIAKHPEHAARILDHEIGKHAKSAEKNGYKPGVRMNITSDFSWEHHAPDMFKRHPNVQFYDYTKMHNRVGHKSLPENYHLSLSHTGTGHAESNDNHAINALEKGNVVAMVYQRGKKVPKPTHVEDVKTGKRYPIADGDSDDNTFDRHAKLGLTPGKHGVVSGLKLKGVKNEDAGVFANKVDNDGIIRINK